MYTVKEARAMLPKVGDKLMRVPTLHDSPGFGQPAPRACTVIQVNEAHLWYRVRFANGLEECYKVPELKMGPLGGLLDD